MIDAWLSSSDRMRTPRPPTVGEHPEVRREAGREEDRPVGAPPGGQLLLELVVDGA